MLPPAPGCHSSPGVTMLGILAKKTEVDRAGSEEKYLQQRKPPINSLSHYHKKPPRAAGSPEGRSTSVFLKKVPDFCVPEKFLTWPHAHGLPISYVSPLLGQK